MFLIPINIVNFIFSPYKKIDTFWSL